MSVLLELLLPELPLLKTSDEEPELTVDTVPVTLGRLIRDPSVRTVDSEFEEADGKVIVRDGRTLESEGIGSGPIVRFHEEFGLVSHEAETLVPENFGVETDEGTTKEVVVPDVWKLEAETEGIKVELALCDELKLPEPRDEVAMREEPEVELLTDSDSGVLEASELGAGINMVGEVIFADLLWLPILVVEADVKAGTVTTLLVTEPSSSAEDVADVVLPLITRGAVVVEFAAKLIELEELKPL